MNLPSRHVSALAFANKRARCAWVWLKTPLHTHTHTHTQSKKEGENEWMNEWMNHGPWKACSCKCQITLSRKNSTIETCGVIRISPDILCECCISVEDLRALEDEIEGKTRLHFAHRTTDKIVWLLPAAFVQLCLLLVWGPSGLKRKTCPTCRKFPVS